MKSHAKHDTSVCSVHIDIFLKDILVFKTRLKALAIMKGVHKKSETDQKQRNGLIISETEVQNGLNF